MCDEQLKEVLKQEPMHTCTKPLLDGTDGALGFAYMTVGQDNIHGDRKEGVEVDVMFEVIDDGAVLAIRNMVRRRISNVSGNDM